MEPILPFDNSGPAADSRFDRFLGRSKAARSVRRQVDKAARVDLSTLVCGESGVGKELVAREIHRKSRRSDRPFLPVNCAAIPESLIESELFGHEAGAFTDAREARRGAFERSHSGTLFLDEVGDLDHHAQPKLLRVLESGEVQRIGGEAVQVFDFRVIAATNHRLKRMCRAKQFRIDLYYRLCVLKIIVPPLRERAEDLPFLARHFAGRLATRMKCHAPHFTDAAMERLAEYSWPGNVRQLQHVVERAMAMQSGHLLGADSFDFDPDSLPGPMSELFAQEWKSARDEFEVAYARQLIKRCNGDVAKAAREAGLATGSLYRMLRRLGLPPGRS